MAFQPARLGSGGGLVRWMSPACPRYPVPTGLALSRDNGRMDDDLRDELELRRLREKQRREDADGAHRNRSMNEAIRVAAKRAYAEKKGFAGSDDLLPTKAEIPHSVTSTRVIIRRATPDDADEIADVHARSWQAGYRGLLPDDVIEQVVAGRHALAERFRALVTDKESPQRVWVALDGVSVVGMAVTGPSRDPDAGPTTGELEAIYLAPEAMGRGIGRALVDRRCGDGRNSRSWRWLAGVEEPVEGDADETRLVVIRLFDSARSLTTSHRASPTTTGENPAVRSLVNVRTSTTAPVRGSTRTRLPGASHVASSGILSHHHAPSMTMSWPCPVGTVCKTVFVAGSIRT